MSQRADCLQLVDDVKDLLDAVLCLLRVIVDALLAFIKQIVALVNCLVLVLIFGTDLSNERFSETVDSLLDLFCVHLG